MSDPTAPRFEKSFTQQEPICEEGIAQALSVLRSGRLHRYNLRPDEAGETSLLEREFADYVGRAYGLACASCGSAMFLALKALGVGPGERVLCNAYTLAPVPGAIAHVGAQAELVEIGEDYAIDLDDLERKAARGNARWLLLSHMRGHIADMDAVTALCDRHGLKLIEDCAHTMGASWDGRESGSFGVAACFSTQTYKHLNSGEGGLLVSDDPELMARATLHSGSYMLYERHGAGPAPASYEGLTGEAANFSLRMDHLRAAILRPQLRELDDRRERWNARYARLETGLRSIPGLVCPTRHPREQYVGSSIQFRIPGATPTELRAFASLTARQGVDLKWFGEAHPVAFTSAYHHWRYLGDTPRLPNTDRILSTTMDMRVPLTFDLHDCDTVVQVIAFAASKCLLARPLPGGTNTAR